MWTQNNFKAIKSRLMASKKKKSKQHCTIASLNYIPNSTQLTCFKNIFKYNINKDISKQMGNNTFNGFKNITLKITYPSAVMRIVSFPFSSVKLNLILPKGTSTLICAGTSIIHSFDTQTLYDPLNILNQLEKEASVWIHKLF